MSSMQISLQRTCFVALFRKGGEKSGADTSAGQLQDVLFIVNNQARYSQFRVADVLLRMEKFAVLCVGK